MKHLTNLFREYCRAGRKACECGGSGKHPCDKRCSEYYFDSGQGCAGNYDGDDVDSNGCPPCPTCAKVREWEGLLEDKGHCQRCGGNGRKIVGTSNLGPIYAQDHSQRCEVCKGKGNTNPDFTKPHDTPDGPVWYVRYVMEEIGLWERFKCWHFNNCSVMVSYWMGDHMGKPINFIAHDAMFDILTNGKLLVDSAIAFMEGRHG